MTGKWTIMLLILLSFSKGPLSSLAAAMEQQGKETQSCQPHCKWKWKMQLIPHLKQLRNSPKKQIKYKQIPGS
jgi:hypothetical protein